MTAALQTKLALRFLLLTFVRTGELRGREWTEIDWDKAEWRIPAERMKMRELHIVPLVEAGNRRSSANCKSSPANRQYIFPNQHKPIDIHEREHDALCAVSHGLSFTRHGPWFPQHRQHHPE